MHITNPDALKGWLTVELEPLCDADPEALARYVLALLKKGKPEKELLSSMLEQLDVFLGAETQSFLARLMEAIKNDSYVQSSANTEQVAPEAAPSVALTSTPSNELSPMLKEDTPTVGAPPLDDSSRIESNQSTCPGSHSPIKAPATTAEATPATSTSAQQQRRRRLSARSRSRSRSRSLERGSRPLRTPRDSRDRNNRPFGGPNAPSYRNKSPPRRFDRRGGGKGSAIDRYNLNRRNHSRSRSRSHSPNAYRKAGSRSLSPNHNSSQNTDGGEPRIQSQIGAQIVVGREKGKKCRDFEEKGYCMRGETCPWDHGVDPVVLEDINNPTLMTIQQQQQHLREYNPDAPDLWNRNTGGGGNGGGFGPRGPPGANGAMRPGEFGQRLPFRLSGGPVVGGLMNPGGLSQLNRELIPVPVVMDGQPVGASHPAMYHHGIMEGSGMGGSKRRYEDQNQPLVPGMEGPPKRKPLLAGRLGPRGSGGGGGPMGHNCSLELRKVPRGLNSIAHLNNHFSRFGKIINIQVNYEQDPEAAVISFSSHAEANVAYRSTEAVLNNRFIKVFWHTGAAEKEEGAEGGKDGEQAPAQLRKMFTNQYQLNNVQKQKDGAGDPTTGPTADGQHPQVAVVAQVASPGQLRLHTQRGIANRRQQEEQVKQAVKMAQGLVKKKHELLQEYLKQMRSCLELIEKVDALDPQRAKLLHTLKDLQESIDKLRKEISEEQAQLTAVQQKQQQHQHPGTAVRKTREQQQKELLDMELELIAQQQEGNDTTPIRKRIDELQRALGRGGPFQRSSVGGANAAVGAGAAAAGGRLAPPGSTSVDRRPTTIFVAGFKLEDSDALLGHFKHFGEITKNVLDRNIPSLIISFAVRVHAEQAMLRGRIFKEKPLKMNWYIPNFVKQREPAGDASNDAVKSTTTQEKSEAADDSELADGVAGSGDSMAVAEGAAEEELPTPADDELRLDEEEEEEDLESEDRSWRR